MSAVLPTKGNLIAIKRSLALARTGYELMDKKRNILIREMMGLIDRASEIQAQIDSVFTEAYSALQVANITLGICDKIAEAIPEDENLEIRYRSVMGVELPTVVEADEQLTVKYGFLYTNSALDDAYIKFNRVKVLTRQLAEVEISTYRLAYQIKKTQKRANALKNIIIPNYEKNVKLITESLEEKEREEFVRLKVIKSQKG